jgi:hypothetical protein
MKRLCLLVLLVAGVVGLSSSMSRGSQAAPNAVSYLYLKVAGVSGSVGVNRPEGFSTRLARTEPASTSTTSERR